MPATTYRVLVSTDLGGDPDDIQSLFRLVHYSDILKIEGLVSSPGPGAKPSVDQIQHWVMRADADHLRERGHGELMSEREILATIRQGHTTPVTPGNGKSSPGSEWIVKRANAPDPEGKSRPLWVLAWGSLTDVAQALHDDPGIAEKIRIYYIGSSNTKADPVSRDYVYAGMKDRWPKLWWIENGVMPHMTKDTFRGVYLGGDQSGEWSNQTFVERNILGHGSTHGSMFKEKCGDVFPKAHMQKGWLKEGDSPSLLYLLSPVLGGVGNIDDPTQESWGGRFRKPEPEKFANYYCDLDADAETCRATISKWRVQFLSDWKKRWDWY